jgi:hypothetical protein
VSTALAEFNPETLIDRISDGAFLRDLAKETGIDKRRLSEKLRKHPDYQAAKETAIEVQLDDAQLALQLAREPADIARAREMFKAAAWRAEREFPGRWGPKSHVTVENVGDLAERLRRAKERTIEGEKPLRISEGTAAGSCIISEDSSATD